MDVRRSQHDSCATWFDDCWGGIFVNINTKLSDFFFRSTIFFSSFVIHWKLFTRSLVVLNNACLFILFERWCVFIVFESGFGWISARCQSHDITANPSLRSKVFESKAFVLKLNFFINLNRLMFDFSLKLRMSYLCGNLTWEFRFKVQLNRLLNRFQRMNFDSTEFCLIASLF